MGMGMGVERGQGRCQASRLRRRLYGNSFGNTATVALCCAVLRCAVLESSNHIESVSDVS